MPDLVTRSGALSGREERDVLAFLGIPFARPPVGEYRFRAPQPPERWRGVRRADRFGASAPQATPALPFLRHIAGPGAAPVDEDCLYLNVWTPRADRRRRAVMVWVHGGAFTIGSGAARMYSGAQLARRGDVVVVTFNYRLGALGFLQSGLPGIEPNLGLRDQIAALEWVQGNIDAFGGDPNNVTLFGESAGGMSVGALLGTPSAAGLFHRAIAQSGAAHNVSTPEQAGVVAERFLAALEIDDARALREASVARILTAQSRASAQLGLRVGTLSWQPSVDGELIPQQPRAAIQDGSAAGVPLLVGTTRDEWKLFMLGDRRARRMDEAGLARRFARALPGKSPAGEAYADLAVEAYRQIDPERGRDTPRERWIAFQSDRVFHYPAARLAELHAAHQPATYAYLFSWSPPLLGRGLGACHGLDVPFAFGTLHDPVLRPLFGATRSARTLSWRMRSAWLAFARSGDPGCEALPDWPRWEPAKRRGMNLGKHCFVREAPIEQGRAFWHEALG